MCIIVYKPTNIAFPNKKTLKTCFENNPDGAGFMYAVNNAVHIEKGFMGFKSFNKALKQVRMQYGDDIPYVLHFRISTQAGTRPDCCHPYPLSKEMDDLRQLKYTSDIAIAHNGIIDLTSSYYDKKVDYNDTMKFITDYLSLIIKSRNFYENDDTLTLIRRLVDSKLAILDGSGKCTLIGEFLETDGVYYSNTSYRAYTTPKTKTYDWSIFKHSEPRLETVDDDYYIDMYNCGYENFGTFQYCDQCLDRFSCPEYIYNVEDDTPAEDKNDWRIYEYGR